MKVARATTGTNTYTDHKSSVITTNFNNDNATYVGLTMVDASDYSTIFDCITGTGEVVDPVRFYAPTPQYINNQKTVYIEEAKKTIKLSNQANTGVNIEIMYLTLQPGGAYSFSNTDFPMNENVLVNMVMAQCGINVTEATSWVNKPYNRIWDVALFTRKFKVYKTKKIVLMPGKSYDFSISKKNYKINGVKMNQLEQYWTPKTYKGICMKFTGTAVADRLQQVAYGDYCLAANVDTTVRWCEMPYQALPLKRPPQSASISTIRVVNPISGGIEPELNVISTSYLEEVDTGQPVYVTNGATNPAYVLVGPFLEKKKQLLKRTKEVKERLKLLKEIRELNLNINKDDF